MTYRDKEIFQGLLPLYCDDPLSQDIFRSGDIDEDYIVDKDPIARGKFAAVRLARHRSTGQIYAAKYIRRRRRAASLEGEARHEIAVLILGRFDPHIVHLHQVYETRSEYITVLEYGAGGDLQRLLDDRMKLSEGTAREILRQVLKGLKFLHERQISHLDIKPQNLVMMSSSPEDGVKLVDFGLSRVILKDTELTQIMGTPDYVAPEVINYEPVSTATDMWAIGVLTYVFLTGCTPFGGETDQETFVNITQGEYEFSDDIFGDVSEIAKDFISNLLLKSPMERMTVEQSAGHPWMKSLLGPKSLSSLSEAESADSGYLTDLCNRSSPPMNFIRPTISICQYPIAEETISDTHNQREINGYSLDILDSQSKISTAHMSINVHERLPASLQRDQSKPQRRSSLVIEQAQNEKLINNNNAFVQCVVQLNANNLYSYSPSYEFDGWNEYINLNNINNCDPHYDEETLRNIAKPWENLCNGSYGRAIRQLPVKSSNQSPKKIKTNLGLRPELSHSMFELQPTVNPGNQYFSPLMKSSTNIKLSKKDVIKSKLGLNNLDQSYRAVTPETSCQTYGMEDRGRTMEIVGNNSILQNIESPKLNLSLGNHECRPSSRTKRELYIPTKETISSKAKIANLKSDTMSPSPRQRRRAGKGGYSPKREKRNLNSNLTSLAQAMMSISHMNLSCNTPTDQNSEGRDLVYADYTLPRRCVRNGVAPLIRGNSFHMSFRRPKKKDGRL